MFGSTKKKRIYLDHASGTPCSEAVFASMKQYFRDQAFNPGGIYKESLEVKSAIESVRENIAKIFKARKEEIYFVDGATESNNLAIIGAIRAWQRKNPEKQAHIITTKIEHAAVLEVCKYFEENNVLVTYLDVDECGYISLKELKESVTENTALVSIGYVNGEIGTIQDIRGVMKTVRHFRKHNNTVYPYVHSDAVQAINYVDEIGVPQLGIDLLTCNASKIYGPKKIGILFKKTGIELDPIIYGGNQEKGIRSGTENVPYIIGFDSALSETRDIYESESERLRLLQTYLENEIKKYDESINLNSIAENKIPNIVNITAPNLSHEELVIRLDAAGFMCSVKSACKAGEDGDSHVIKAISSANRPTGSLRISLGRTTTKKDCKEFMKSFKVIVDMMKETYDKYYS
ncbi:MAG: cysteine desulfurase [Candidatus Pacebacteria bacterium]|nr:cysteine desulfurase [Candidatus Paceibacterota bacterium]